MPETVNYKSIPHTPLAGLSHIPGKKGLPVLGMTPALFRDFYGTLKKHYETYGNVSKIGIGFQTVTYECAFHFEYWTMSSRSQSHWSLG